MPTTYCTLHKNILTSLQNKEFYRNTHSHFHCLPALYRNTHSQVLCQKHKRTCQMLTCTLHKHIFYNINSTFYRHKNSHAHCSLALDIKTHSQNYSYLILYKHTFPCPLMSCTLHKHTFTCAVHTAL